MRVRRILTEDGKGRPDSKPLRDGRNHQIESELDMESAKLYSDIQPSNETILLHCYIVGIKRSA